MVIAIVLFCFFQIQKHWKIRQAPERAAITVDAGIELRGQTEGVQPYLQNKAELGVERTESEIQPEEIHELMDGYQCQELPGDVFRQPKPSFGEQHELRGEENARELDSSPDRQQFQGYNFDEPNFGVMNESALTLHEFA